MLQDGKLPVDERIKEPNGPWDSAVLYPHPLPPEGRVAPFVATTTKGVLLCQKKPKNLQLIP